LLLKPTHQCALLLGLMTHNKLKELTSIVLHPFAPHSIVELLSG